MAVAQRKRINAFMVDGQPMPAPDNDMEASFEDLDGEDAGRTLDGVMHRSIVRSGLAKWPFVYGILCAEDYRYLQNLFKGKSEFTFTYPGENGPVSVTAYRSKYSITLHNYTTGDWRNYKFDIIEC